MTQRFYINSTASISPQPTFGQEGSRVFPEGKQLHAIEPDYKSFIPNPTLRRRMSRIVRMGVAAGLKCLEAAGNPEVGSIITATGLGCLADTEKFMNTLLDNDEQLLNPTAFIQSTFNTVGAQIALLSKNHAYNTTYVHRGFSFESALLDGMMKLAEGETRSVLVGAVDELTPTQFRIMERMGCWRHAVAGEGAQFFVVAGEPADEKSVELVGIDTLLGPATDEEVESRLVRFLASHGVKPEEVDWVLSGEEEKRAEAFHPVQAPLNVNAPLSSPPGAGGVRGGREYSPFKTLCGEYPTAASFALWLACKVLRDGNFCDVLPPRADAYSFRHVLIYNRYGTTNHAFYLLKRQ